MKSRMTALLTAVSMLLTLPLSGCSNQTPDPSATPKSEPTASSTPMPTPEEEGPPTETPKAEPKEKGAFETQAYRNVFEECGYTEQEIADKVNQAWNDLFYGDDETRIFFDAGNDEAYILDTGNGDVRSEGMSYGMMMCVQMDKKKEFDQLWKWAKNHMQHTSGPNEGYFAWSMNQDGTPRDPGPAPDGEEYFALALFFASNRWGDGEAPFDYGNQARYILRQAIHKPDTNSGGFNLWDVKNKLIRFVPSSSFSDPSYHLPHFYELFALWADEGDRAFWKEAAAASREYLNKVCNAKTGLAPDYATFEGFPMLGQGNHDKFAYDAFRVAGNIGLDYAWFAADPRQKDIANRIQAFFVKEGIGKHYSNYTVDGIPIKSTNYQSTGLVAMNAMASLAADGPNVKAMVDDLWSKSPGKGQWRYYDDCLYFFSVLALSGSYRIWLPSK